MGIQFDAARWARTKETYRRWWAGELDRPLVAVTLWGGDAGRPEPKLPSRGFTAHYDKAVGAEAIVDRWDYDLSSCRFLGDAFPSVWPNFGPGVAAAFMGCRLETAEHTVWYHPEKAVGIRDLHFNYNPDAFWFRRIADIMKAASARWQGQVQVGMTDLGGAVDILSSFRPGEELLLDLYDAPEEVRRLVGEAHQAWWQYFKALDGIVRPTNPGYTAWTPILSPDPYYMLQCDFAYMIGPGMFDDFVQPELAASCRKLKNAFYHLDGVGQIPHLDSLLRIPELKGIQWVPGAGQPDASNWPEIYRRIRKAGKHVQLFGEQYKAGNYRIIDVLKEQLGSAKGIIVITGAGPDEEKVVREFLDRHGIPAE